MTMVTGASHKAGAQMNRQQRRQAARLAKKRPRGSARPGAGNQGFGSDTDGEIQAALRLHQGGKFQAAAGIYRRVLDRHPDHSDALHLLGLAAFQTGQTEAAVESIGRALAINPRFAEAHNSLGAALQAQGKPDEALACYRRAIASKSDYVEAHNNLGNVLKDQGKNDEAIVQFQRALAIDPNYAAAHNNLGNLLQENGRLDDAVACYRSALAISPNLVEAHNGLGTALHDRGDLDEAVVCYHKALAIQPNIAEAYNNLGTSLLELGRLEDCVASYHKALAIKPDFAVAWKNLRITTKALQFPKVTGDRRDAYPGDGLSDAACATTEYAMFEYYLDKFRPHEADESFRRTMAALPPKAAEEVTVYGTDHRATNPPQLPDKLVALLHFGRSGTGLLHSLIDGHPEISTLPSIYLKGFFTAGVWNQIAADGWRGLPERFADAFEVLFDADSPKPIPGAVGEDTAYLGRKEGMTALGKGRNISLSLDRDKFCSEAYRLMNCFEKVDPGSFLRIVHAAFEKTVETKTRKHTAFYHIHNPDDFAKLNLLRYVPDARLVMMVREPIQSCESWIQEPFKENNYNRIATRITLMLFALDQVAFRKQDSVGVRLEDLKRRPKATMRGLCAWLGIEETPSLYESTAQGEKWWGDPTSPEYKENGAISAFSEAPIRRAVGKIFSEKDQLVLRTLFYPFSVRFGYREPDPVGFNRNLKEIRPLLDDLLDFETVLSERLEIDPAHFKRSGYYRLFRANLMDRWDVLNQFGDYPNMLTPLDIERDR